MGPAQGNPSPHLLARTVTVSNSADIKETHISGLVLTLASLGCWLEAWGGGEEG